MKEDLVEGGKMYILILLDVISQVSNMMMMML